MKYKAGDVVRVKDDKWFADNAKMEDGFLRCGNGVFWSHMAKMCGKALTIATVMDSYYIMKEDPSEEWTDEMLEGLASDNPRFKVGDKVLANGYTQEFTVMEYYPQTVTYKISDTKETLIVGEILLSDYKITKFIDIDVETPVITEGLIEEETKPNIIEEAKTYWDSIKDAWICPEGYQFKDENGNVINATKIVLEKKKKEYPKTYEECCKVLGIEALGHNVDGYKWEILATFQNLIVCRDAYWKIAGEEMRLGKPWEPDYTDPDQDRYTIVNFMGNIEKTKWDYAYSTTFVFPTEEIRNAFKENFDPDIEICKELL